MTDTEQKALALLNEVQNGRGHTGSPWNSPTILNEALYRAIEQHEVFRQEVSEAAEQAVAFLGSQTEKHPRGRQAISLARFIIAKPDPLVEVLEDIEAGKLGYLGETCAQAADTIRAAIEKRGGKIVWGEG